MFLSVCVLLIIASSLHHQIEATRCKSSSYFKIDCNLCRCSEDGTHYTCSSKMCYNPFRGLERKNTRIELMQIKNDINRGSKGY
ncbi:hypothetical protein Trydic_g5561 [Trypoxylus dichotomus]